MIKSMVMVKKIEKMVIFMLAIIIMVKWMDLVNLHGLKMMGRRFMKDCGKIQRWMDMEELLRLMGKYNIENIKKERKYKQ